MFKDSFNIPNLLTSLRLLFSPILAVLLIYDSMYDSLNSKYAVLIIVLFSELTDMLDGYMARKHGQVTDLGKLLDPMADSIYRDTIFLSLAVIHQVSLFLVLPILYRDSIIQTLRTVCAYNGIVVAARTSGKIKAIIQAISIILILLLRIWADYDETIAANLYLYANMLLGIVCAITLYSAFDYLGTLIPIIMNRQDPKTDS